MGDMAVVWGSNFIVADAAACCDACNAHALICGKPGSKDQKFFDGAPHPCGDNPEHACNMWVFCDGGGAATDNRWCVQVFVRAPPAHGVRTRDGLRACCTRLAAALAAGLRLRYAPSAHCKSNTVARS